jgi:hypothetical protein
MGILYKTYLGFIFLILGVGIFFIVTNSELFQNNEQIEDEQTCMELMDMDFPNEKECLEFVQHLFDIVEDKSDPLMMKLMEKYNP